MKIMNKTSFRQWMLMLAGTVGLAGLMTGCGIYSSYSRPDDLQVDGIYGEPAANADTVSIADIAWRDFFTDPYLQDLIDSVLVNNADMRIAFLRVEESEASLKAAKLAFIPSFGLAVSGGPGNQVPVTIHFGYNITTGAPSYTYNAGISASWQVDLFGGLRNAKKQAQAGLLQMQAYRQAVRTQLIANTAILYYKLVTLDEQLSIYTLTKQSWEESLEATRALMEAGMGNTAAVAQSEGAYYSVCASIPNIQQQIRETENQICALLGITPRHIRRGEMPVMVFANDLRVGIPISLLSRRPDVMQAEQALARAFYVTNAARSAFYPSISLSGSLGWKGGADLIWSALASLTQPIFQNGRLTAQLKIAKAQQEEAKISFQQTLLEAGMEVN
ncbi:MAG: TolC family protein, partial [Bacteroidales bacterium]|nr:TolC family protein [Bacteroidales bacterium]